MAIVLKTFSNAALALGVMLALVTTGIPSSLAAEPTSKTERIEQLLELTNSADMGIQVMEQMIAQFQLSMPEVPDEWWDRFMAKVSEDDLNGLIIPIYERNFTDAEINAMIAFYETPEGQSVIEKMPVVMQESMMSGQAWGAQLGEEILRELEADGYELQTSLPVEAPMAL